MSNVLQSSLLGGIIKNTTGSGSTAPSPGIDLKLGLPGLTLIDLATSVGQGGSLVVVDGKILKNDTSGSLVDLGLNVGSGTASQQSLLTVDGSIFGRGNDGSLIDLGLSIGSSGAILAGLSEVAGLSGLSNLLGGIAGGTSGTGGTSAGGLFNTGLLDGLVDVELLSDKGLLNLSLLDGGGTSGLANLTLLDPDGDGLIDINLLNGAVGVSAMDPDGNGLVEVDILDVIGIGISADKGTPGGGTDPAAYEAVITGTHGSDQLTVGSQATFIQGMRGVDTVSYGTPSKGFSYKSEVNGVFIDKGAKVDFLQDVERVKFSDGTLVLDTGAGENAGVAYRLYEAALDRAPEASGLRFWIDKLDAGESIGKVAGGFIFSPEFMQKYGQLSNRAFVGQLYENILERQGEASGLNYYVNRLDQGLASRAEVLIGFSESPENIAAVGVTIESGVFLTA